MAYYIQYSVGHGKINVRMYISFILQEKDKEQSQKCKEIMLLKTYFCYL